MRYFPFAESTPNASFWEKTPKEGLNTQESIAAGAIRFPPHSGRQALGDHDSRQIGGPGYCFRKNGGINHPQAGDASSTAGNGPVEFLGKYPSARTTSLCRVVVSISKAVTLTVSMRRKEEKAGAKVGGKEAQPAVAGDFMTASPLAPG